MLILTFQVGVFIHEIHAGGAAEKLGLLHQGDLVTKVNNVDSKSITHKDALIALRASEKVTFQINALQSCFICMFYNIKVKGISKTELKEIYYAYHLMFSFLLSYAELNIRLTSPLSASPYVTFPID